MPATKSTATSLFTAIVGTLGFSALAGVLVTVMVAPAIAVTGVTANNTVGIFNSLPDYMELDPGSQQNTIAVVNPDDPTTYIDIATLYKQNREEVSLGQISDYAECAAIAGEDRRFYEHGGVDLPSLVRATLGQVTNASDSGASTLTMQLVRNIWQQQALNDESKTPAEQNAAIEASMEQSIDRKLREMKLAIGLEKNYTKDEILSAYLNIANFGGNTYGVQAAAFQYFGKDAADLTIVEAASLIAIVQRPSVRNLGSPDNYQNNQIRRDVILTAMADYGCITRAERDEALAIPVDDDFVNLQSATVGCRNATPGYGFVCDYAKRIVTELSALGGSEAERKQAWDRGGYRLVLTIDPRLQGVANDTVNTWAPANEDRFRLGASAVSVQVGTGRIVSMAQNKTFDDSTEAEADITRTSLNFAVDRAHGGSRYGFQPGSTYKPYVLLAYLAAGNGINESFNAGIREVNQAEFTDSCPPPLMADGSPRIDPASGTPVSPPWGGRYQFRNDSNEQGSYTVMRGTGASVNSVFIQMAKAVDQCEIAKLAASIGVHNGDGSDLVTRPSCSIGGCENAVAPLQQAAAYAAIANQGVYCAPIMIDAVVVVATGEVLEGQQQDCNPSLVSSGVANTAAHVMQGTMSATGSEANPRDGTPYMGKTGTTDKSVHTWMVGSSTAVATAVWVGNSEGEQAMRNVRVNGTSGGLLRHRIFRPIAQTIDGYYPGGAFPGPDPSLLTGTPIEVPNVVGGSLESAKRILELAELVFEDGGQIDSDLPAGQVVSTEPAVGTGVSRGTTVRVFTSNGLAVAVPNVVGLQRNAARSQLESADFDVDDECVDDTDLGNPSTPPTLNSVTSQDPTAGTFRNPSNTTVTIRWYGGPICPP